MAKQLFPLGRIVATPGALEVLAEAGTEAADLLDRHAAGFWGEVCEEDWKANEEALRQGWRLLRSYNIAEGEKVWIITEADRSATTLLLPEEYLSVPSLTGEGARDEREGFLKETNHAKRNQ